MGYRFRIDVVWDNLEFLLQGAVLTLVLSALAIVAGVVIGAVVASIRMSSFRLARMIAIAYIDILRAVPLLVQLYVLFFAFPRLGIFMDSFQAGIVALTLYSSAYLSEIIRAGLESVPTGQVLAGKSLGFSGWDTFRHIVLPQAVGRIRPPLGNQFIDTTLSSSLLAVIGSAELTQNATIVNSATFRPFEVYAVVAIIYYLLTRLLIEIFVRGGFWARQATAAARVPAATRAALRNRAERR